MSNKVYVGKLAAETTEKNLEEMFSKVGEIISIDISKKITFQPNAGSAYIVMKIDSDASKAVKELSNTELLGSRIVVTEAHTIDQKGHKYYYSKRRRR